MGLLKWFLGDARSCKVAKYTAKQIADMNLSQPHEVPHVPVEFAHKVRAIGGTCASAPGGPNHSGSLRD